MNKKIKFISIILLVIFLTTGCSTITNIFKKDSGIQLIDLHTGKKAIIINFLDNAPPRNVFAPMERNEEAPFPAGFKISNVGAADVTVGYITLGLEKDYMELQRWNLEGTKFVQEGTMGDVLRFSLLGKKQLTPLGDEELITFMLNTLPLDPQSERHTSSILLTTCYEYQTELGAETCIDTDIYNLRPLEKVCTPQTLSFSRGQGAPVTITKVEPKMAPIGDDFVRPMFLIYVENLGDGLVVKSENVKDACTSSKVKQDKIKNIYNLVEIDEISFSDYSFKRGDIECEPQPLLLKENRGFIRCSLTKNLPVRETPTYQTNLYIKLKYGYTQTISKNIEIEKLLTY